MAKKFHGNVGGEVRVNPLALLATKPHIFMRGALKMFWIVCAHICLNFVNPSLFWPLNNDKSRDALIRMGYRTATRACKELPWEERRTLKTHRRAKMISLGP